MPSWKKVVASGSDASFSSVFVDSFVSASSFKGSFTGSLQGTASQAISSSYALTASYALISTEPIIVTSPGGIYYINGVAKPVLTFVPGQNYRFDTTAVDGHHPFKFSLTANGPTQYTYGVTSGSGFIEINVDYATSSSLFYYCTIHSGMGNQANTLRDENLIHNSQTSSMSVLSSSYAYTASSATNAAQAISASYSYTASSATNSEQAISASYAYTASSSTNSEQAISASYAYTASSAISAYTASSAINAKTALTASSADTFLVRNDITASSALIIGTITAQTLVVQTVSSSIVYSSGSNTFGNALTDRQTFTGSVDITGSLTVNGSEAILTNQTASMAVASAISASYALNGGVTQILAGANVTIAPTSGKGQVTISATGGGGSNFNTATGSYGSFYDTTTQTNPVANTPRSMSFNTTDITNGVSISGSTSPFNTYIKTENPGVYDIQFSAQLDKTDSGKDEVLIWLRKNGIDLTDTATSVSLTNNNDKVVAAWNWFVNSSANDYYQIIWYSADTDLRLLAETAGGGHPGIPSIIATVNRVDQFLSNSGSFSGSFSGALTGSLHGTASWAQNASTASYVVTAQTASYVANAVSSSYAYTASSAINASASLIAVSASYALTASYALNAGASSGFPFSGSAQITGSLGVTGSFSVNGNTGQTVFASDADTLVISGSLIITGSASITGSLKVSGSITGSLFGTASWAQNAVSASQSVSSSYALTASYALFAANGGGGGVSAIYILDEGVVQGTASYFDFTGAGVTATVNAGTASINIPGGGGGSNTNSQNAILNQSSPAVTWSFSHNLSTLYPVFTIYDNEDNVIIPQKIHAETTSSAFIYFSSARTGTAVASKGGDITSASFAATASLANFATSASYSYTASSAISASLAQTASYVVTAQTASYVLNAVSASYAFTASSAINASASLIAISASQAETASSANTFVVRNDITASNALITGTITAQTLVVQTVTSSIVYSSGSNIFGNSTANTQTFTGSVNITGSLNLDGKATLTDLTGSLFGTSSWAQNASTASYVLNAISSSYAFTASSAISSSLAETASYVVTAQTASYVANAVSSSYAYTASSAISSSLAETASYVVTAQTASYVENAVSSSYAYTASSSVSSSYAYTASSAINASASLTSVSASYALTASFALNGGGGGLSALFIADEGATQGTASYINFTGAGVTATVSAGTASINITGGGSSGTSGLSTTFTQSVAATEWTFIHNLNTRYPLIQVYDTTFNQVTPQYVSSSTADTVIIGFGIATAGYAVASNGGTLYVTGSNVILDQAVAAATWSFNHNLNTQYPIFQVFDSTNEVIIPERIVATDATSSLFYFPSPVAGKAVASVGGISGSMGSGVGFPFSGSAVITGSFLVSQSFVDFSNTTGVTGSFSGSLFGTASYATFALSASFAPGFTTNMSQSVAATTWSFTHNLNTINPIVQVYDLTNSQIIPNQIVGMNNSTAEIRFDYAQAGYAVASNGGGLYVTGSTSTLVQTAANVTWSFTHNLNNKYNTYEVYDDSDLVIIPSGIKALTNNTAELYFAGPQTGRAVAQFSGINGSPNAATASFANTASFVSNLTQNVFITGSLTVTGSAAFTGSFSQNNGFFVLTQVSQSLNFANDAAAATGGVPLGGLYRSGNFILIRLS
jgi:hypothetical protein